MKAFHKFAAGLAIVGLGISVAIATPQSVVVKPVVKDDGVASGVATTAAGLNYSTDFENPPFVAGYIVNSPTPNTPPGCGGAAFPCWGHTTNTSCASGAPGPSCGFSTITPTIENGTNPAGGLQHARLSFDPNTRTNTPNFGRGVDIYYPRNQDVSTRPVAPSTMSFDMAIDAPGGQSFLVFTDSFSEAPPGFIVFGNRTLFYTTGAIYVVDDVCGTQALGFQPTGSFWDTTGGYQNYTLHYNPCGNSFVQTYGGLPLYAGCMANIAQRFEQFRTQGDNFPGGILDIDNFSVSMEELCPSECHNGILESPPEECDDGPGNDANCPGRCVDCVCQPVCTEAAPCPVENGANGPFISSSGFYIYSGGSPFISADTCGSNYDSSILLTVASSGAYLNYNDDCTGSGPFSSGHDTSASCFGASSVQSCTCAANPGEAILIQADQFGAPAGLGSSTMVNIRKKTACAGASVGACCDTNGADTGCTDNVTEANCTGPDKVWTNQGKCADQNCMCIPDCTGATCGSDGCGGSCGECSDGNVCNGEETCNANRTCDAGSPLVCNDGNACNGVETCDPVLGCRPGTPLNCDNGVACDGQETCNPSSGCVGGTAVNCDDGIDCTVDACNEPDGSCSHDDADCSIPTVSEWGLVVLALMLLIGAKVYFGRRQQLA